MEALPGVSIGIIQKFPSHVSHVGQRQLNVDQKLQRGYTCVWKRIPEVLFYGPEAKIKIPGSVHGVGRERGGLLGV